MVYSGQERTLRSSRIVLLIALLVGAYVATAGWGQSPVTSRPEDARRVPVIVELFTSEGCSSCPPADRLLVELDRKQPVEGAEIIALGEHVDYWDQLGWKDRFSAAEFTARQSVYSRAFGLNSTYTPQMVVDGHAEFVGNDAGEARRAIARAARAPKAAVQIAPAEVSSADDRSIPLVVRVDRLPDFAAHDSAEVLLAITESQLASDVRRGENAGRTLSHTAVVRRLTVLGRTAAGQGPAFFIRHVFKIELEWKRENLRAVVFVQERAGGRILGAASLPLTR